MSATQDLGEHRAIVTPDSRRRWPLGRLATREPVLGWRVFASADGRTLRLEAILENDGA
jgi:hypothetical protein